MGKIGSYDYPELSVDESIRVAETLVNDFQKNVNDTNEFASRIGHKSSSSGTFLVKMGNIRKYGLMDKREYRATKRAEVLANPKTSQEKNQEIKEMILSIPLFEKLNNRLKTKSPTIEQFKTQLIEITGDRERGSKEAEKIRKIYIDAIAHIKETKDIASQTNNGADNFFNMDNEQPNTEDLILFKLGKTNLSLEKNDANLDVLISILTNLKGKK